MRRRITSSPRRRSARRYSDLPLKAYRDIDMRSDRTAHVRRNVGSSAMHQRQRGMSLVELMVGILVGLLVVMAASGSLAFFEAQRTTSLTGNAAMNSGMMGGYLLQRDLRNAGVGLFNTSQLSCTRLNVYF